MDLVSIHIGGGLFNVKFVLLLAALPNISVPEVVGSDANPAPMPFRFDGGDGLLLGLRRKYDHHIETQA